VLPSLWEAVAGTSEITWSTRDEEGRFLNFSPEFGRVWRWKDELPERRLACVGKHVRGRSAAVALKVMPVLLAAKGASEPASPLEQAVVDFLAEHGPCSTADIPELIGYERKPVAAAVDRLQRRLVVTTAGSQERAQGWPAVVVDLLARRYAEHVQQLPAPEEARVALARLLGGAAGEVSAADVAAVVGCSRKEAAVALDELADLGAARRRDGEGFALYVRSGRRAN
jgi:hypothetical protein